jgi:hypothetical protein
MQRRQGSPAALPSFHPPPSEASLFCAKLHTSFFLPWSIARPESARASQFIFPVPQVLRIRHTACVLAKITAGHANASATVIVSCEDIRRPIPTEVHSACFGSTGQGNSPPRLRYRSGNNRWCQAFVGSRSVDVVSRTQTCFLLPPRVQTRQGRWRYFGPAASLLDHPQGGSGTSQPAIHIGPFLALYRCVFGGKLLR